MTESVIEFVETVTEDMGFYYNSLTTYHFIFVNIDNDGEQTEVATYANGQLKTFSDYDARYVLLNEVVASASAESERYDMYIYMYDYPEEEVPDKYWKGVWYAG